MMLMVVVAAVLMCMQPTARAQKVALLIIDVQDCFLPQGSLAVPDGQQVIPVINGLRQEHEDIWSAVVLTQDWHCADHVSFASQHPGFKPFDNVPLSYNRKGALCYGQHVSADYPHAVDCSGQEEEDLLTVSQTLWPDHCIINVTAGPTSSQFSPLLTVKDSDFVVRKGDTCGLDSYSAFFDNGGFQQTHLHHILQELGVTVVVVTGLALDFCVYYTSRDAHMLGYRVLTVTDASRGVMPETTAAALQDLRDLGVELVEALDLERHLQDMELEDGLVGLSTMSLSLTLLLGALLLTYFCLKERQ